MGTISLGGPMQSSKRIASMGKLVNPFASHAKDPRFEPEWNQVAQASCHVHFFVLSNPETLN